MRKNVGILTIAVAIGGLAGWMSARTTLERRELQQREQVESVRQQWHQRIRDTLVDVILHSDRITVESAADVKNGRPESAAIAISDVQWRREFARQMGGGTYVRTPLPLGLFPPFVQVFKNGREVLFYQAGGLISGEELEPEGALRLDPQTADQIDRLLLPRLSGQE